MIRGLSDLVQLNLEHNRLRFEERVTRYLEEVNTTPATDGETTGGSTNTNSTKVEKSPLQKTMEGIGYSFLFIFMSEIGDKTFLFVVLYATRMNGMKLLIVSAIGL